MATPRAIRIPRASATAPPATGAPVALSPTPLPPQERPAKLDLRQNQAANERARRLTIIYLGALVVLYVGFVLLDRASPGGTSATAETGMLYFSGIAAALAVGGIWVAFGPVPRAIEVHPEFVVVIESWGKHRRFPPIGEIRVSLVRLYPKSFLSSRAVEVAEIVDDVGHRRTYHLEEGLLPERRPEPG